MKRLIATLLVIAMLMGMALTVTATSDSSTLPDVDCSGFRSAGTEGIEITEDGVYFTFTGRQLLLPPVCYLRCQRQ